MADRPSWRELDRKKDQSFHRQEEKTPPKNAARVASSTATYKRQLDAFFDRGVVPESLKDKLPAKSTGEGPSGRQVLMRAVQSAEAGEPLEKALDALIKAHGLPAEDADILLKALSHPSEPLLLQVVAAVSALVDTGKPLPRKKLFLERLKGVEAAAFDPALQAKAKALVDRLR